MKPNLNVVFLRTLLVLGVGIAHVLVGCNASNNSDEPFTATFHQRELSAAEQAQRKQLLHNIVNKTYLNQRDLEAALKGKAVADCEEVLSLADSFSVYGQYLVHAHQNPRGAVGTFNNSS